MIRSSTSVAANYRACCLAQTPPGFISKISIAIEEADETCFWLEFIVEEGLVNEDAVQHILNEGQELVKILVASRKTAMEKLKELTK